MIYPDYPILGPRIHEADREFMSRVVELIPGWLMDYVALRIMELMRWQTGNGVSGPALEIGVYAGRCFAVMLREAARAGDLTVGIDTFHRVSEDQARQHLGLPAGATEVQFLHGRSAEFDESRLLATLAGPARFVSIDGSHMLEDVRHDLSVCDAILSPSGIIACDDFLNPVRLGVGQAIHEHLSQGTTLAPFAYIQNKLFLCRRSLHADLLQLCHILCAADASGGGALYARNAQAKNGRNETQLYGWPLLVVP